MVNLTLPGTNKGACSSDKVKTSQEACGLQRKSSVMMYNHSTRDTRDLPYGEDKFVVRDLQAAEDAYSQAMKEVSAIGSKSKEQTKKQQDMRNKVAVTKQNVEKEYKDTMNFLNSLPKDKQSKTIVRHFYCGLQSCLLYFRDFYSSFILSCFRKMHTWMNIGNKCSMKIASKRCNRNTKKYRKNVRNIIVR